MARGKFITDFERDFIRIGVAAGITNAEIARALDRTRAVIGKQVEAMRAEGTLEDLPQGAVVENIKVMLREAGSLNRAEQ